VKKIFLVLISLFSVAVLAAETSPKKLSDEEIQKLFEPIGKVVTHARCMNCHTNGEFPRQTDSRHRHGMNVVRGADDHGSKYMKCTTCHQATNSFDGKVPGAGHWFMPNKTMGWEGLTANEICHVMIDPKKNGNRKTPREVVDHMFVDPLVQWAWNPGGDRTKPPITFNEFTKALTAWEQAGVPCPKVTEKAKAEKLDNDVTLDKINLLKDSDTQAKLNQWINKDEAVTK